MSKDAPFLQLNLLMVRSCLGSDKFLEIADRIVGAAFDTNYSMSQIEYDQETNDGRPLRPKRSFAMTYKNSELE